VLMGSFIKDIQYAVRALWGAPGFTAVAVLTLALGIGANTAIFSVIDDVLLRPLPYPAAEELVVVGGVMTGLGNEDARASSTEYREFAERAGTLSGLAASWVIDANVTEGLEPERVRVDVVTSNYFSVLGQPLAMGRDFELTDAGATGVDLGYVTILSHDTWQRMFQGDPEIVGQSIRLDDDPFTIIGVMPEGFENPSESRSDRVSMWITISLKAGNRWDGRGFRPFTLIGRMNSGASMEVTRAEFEAIGVALIREDPQVYPEAAGWATSVESLFDLTVGDVRASLLVLFWAVGFVLLTACTNVANLLLTRGHGRSREMAIRVSLGGGRARITGQLLTESLVLVVAGGALGLGVAALGLEVLRDITSTVLPRLAEATIDGRVLAFTFGVSLLTILLFGLFPALHGSKAQPQDVLREGHAGGARHTLARNTLATVQIAMSLVLLVSAGLLAKSFSGLVGADPGFEPEGVLALQTWLPIPNDPSTGRFATVPARADFADRVLEALDENPVISASAVTSLLPYRGLRARGFAVEGEATLDDEVLPTAEYREVSPDYFEVMGVPLIRGRGLLPSDDQSNPRVVVIDRRLSERWFDGEPLGRRIMMGRGDGWEIVGVVGNVRDQALDAVERPHIYVNYRQSMGLNITFLTKTAGEPEALEPFGRAAIQGVDRDQPVFGVSSMEGVIRETLTRERLMALLIGLFAGLALALVAIGVYGVMAYGVRQRHREIGIRIALGASRRRVLRSVLAEGSKITGLGVVVGLITAAAATRLLASVLHDVGRLDPGVFAGVACATALVALTACLVPALRAAGIDPIETMRVD
jgi:putative ABC transport system permease protein